MEIGYEETGPAEGPPVILLHGWPSDPHDWDGVVPELAAEGCHVLVPWLRGYGPTRFLHRDTPRSGQQAALGADVRDFMDALGIEDAHLAGYDWGGRAACVVAALWPERVRGLVSIGGYNIQNIAVSGHPAPAAQEHRLWYQWYFHTERGHAGLEQNRRDIARLLWRLWSPNWQFDDAIFDATAPSFDNPDFVAVTIQSYRHRYGLAAGRPGIGADRAAPRRPTADHGAGNRAARRGRRRLAGRAIGAPRRPLRRPIRPPRGAGRRPFPVARNPTGRSCKPCAT